MSPTFAEVEALFFARVPRLEGLEVAVGQEKAEVEEAEVGRERTEVQEAEVGREALLSFRPEVPRSARTTKARKSAKAAVRAMAAR